LIKDAVMAGVKRGKPGPSYRHFPGWLPRAFFDELQAETRDAQGVWRQIRKRNESLDLCCYIHAGCLRLGLDKVKDWEVVPDWLLPPDRNSDCITSDERRQMKTEAAQTPQPIAQPVRARRVSTSAYLR
jgi:phage terminase large subunit GpA-like protein